MPTFLEILWLLAREPKKTLYNYAWAMGWKVCVCPRARMRMRMRESVRVFVCACVRACKR